MVFALPPGMAQALELVHRGSTFRVLVGSRQRASRWTPEYVKLLLSPRHSRGITLVYLQCSKIYAGQSRARLKRYFKARILKPKPVDISSYRNFLALWR